jgi:glycosyltransferase involved in cell wall biosynthesis
MGTKQKIKVCHLISGDLWAGPEVQVYSLLVSLKTVPYLDISVIVLNEGKLAEKLRRSDFRLRVIEESKHTFFKIFNLIKKELKDKEIDILHTHRYKENVLGGMLKKRCKIKRLVQTVHGLSEPFTGIKNLKINLYSKLNQHFTNNYFDKVLTVSFDMQDKLSAIITPEKLITIHNAINTANLKVNKAEFEVRQEFGIEKGCAIIGSVGRMVPIKGYDIFLRAAELILKVNPEVNFILAGDGPLKLKLESIARNMGLNSAVRFAGFRSDILETINCFDIFVVSSYYEGIPIALLQAMALKKAIVATGVGGVNEIIENGTSGFLVESGNADEIASACITFLNNTGIRKKMGAEARKRVEEEFSVEIQKERILRLYNEMMNQA